MESELKDVSNHYPLRYHDNDNNNSNSLNTEHQLMDVTDSSSCRSMSMSMSYSSSSPYFLSTTCSTRPSSSPSSPRPRRRASQGSVSTQRVQSPLSRFLSAKEKAALHISSLSNLGTYSQSPSSHKHSPRRSSPFAVSQPMSLDTAVPCDLPQPDHSHSLPLTPPADEDDHVGWVIQSDGQAVTREPKPQVAMDETRDRHSASPSQHHRDDKTAFSALPGRRSSSNDVNMSEQDMHSQPPPENWLENGIQTTGK